MLEPSPERHEAIPDPRAVSLCDLVHRVSPNRRQNAQREEIASALERGEPEASTLLRSMNGIAVLPAAPEGMRCISYLFGHLLGRPWGAALDNRSDPPPLHREPLIVHTREMLEKEGYLAIARPTLESIRAGAVVVYGELFATGFKLVSTTLSQGERTTFLVPAGSKPPAFVADHFGLVVGGGSHGQILVESKLGRGPACIHELEVAPYGKDVVFFEPAPHTT